MGYPKKHRGRRKRGSKYRRNKKRQKKKKSYKLNLLNLCYYEASKGG